MYHNHQSLFRARQLAMLGIASLVLSACGGSATSSHTADSTAKDVFKAATGPLDDLNLRRDEIPEPLQKLVKNPYEKPVKVKCPDIKAELASLDDLLGPDVDFVALQLTASTSSDSMALPDRAELISDGENLAHDGVISFIRSQTNILPFRSLVRRITGADRHAREVAKAYQAGQLRRAYLKGLAQAHFGKRCLTPPTIIEAHAVVD